MNPTSFHEFYQVLLAEIKENFPNIELYIVSGGDHVQDLILEARFNSKRLRFSPYELYHNGNDCEGAMIQLFKDCEVLTTPS